MILVDTSVWVDHLRQGDDDLIQMLEQQLVCIHPMIVGELACGNLRQRALLISLWRDLPQAPEASHDEALFLLESEKLMGRGIGYVDLHLLAACRLSPNTGFWTRDKRLAQLAAELGIASPQW